MATNKKLNIVNYFPVLMSEDCAETLMKMGIIHEIEGIKNNDLVITDLHNAIIMISERMISLEKKMAEQRGEVQ